MACILSLYGIAEAQSGSIGFPNGITVAIKTEIIPSNNSDSLGNGYSTGTTSSNNICIAHRAMTDSRNKIYFGYDVVVEKLADTEKFLVTIKPLSKPLDQIIGRNTVGNNPDYTKFTARSLPKYPDAVILDDGDTLTLDILENPQTLAKISDIIKVTSKPQKFGNYFSEREKAKDFTIDEVNLHLDTPQFSINGEKIQTGSSVSGNLIWFYLLGKGRFIFSFSPQPGYEFQKTGVILDNKIMFEHNGERFELINKSPVLGSGGKWNLWVMFDPNYRSSYKLTVDAPYQFGAVNKIDHLFDNK